LFKVGAENPAEYLDEYPASQDIRYSAFVLADPAKSVSGVLVLFFLLGTA
jgi:hypothetical protein